MARMASEERTSVGSEMARREGALARAAGTDQQHQRVGRQGDDQPAAPLPQRVSGSSSSAPLLRTLFTAGETG